MRCGRLRSPPSSHRLPRWPRTGARKARETPARPVAAPAAQAQPAVAPQSIFLIRSTLLALNDANRTGNYTVLRDLASPAFRERNSAADLAVTFAQLRRSNLDLGIAALMEPALAAAPVLDAERRLHLKGEFATRPNRLVFELAFEDVRGRWQLHDISLATRPDAPAVARNSGKPSSGAIVQAAATAA